MTREEAIEVLTDMRRIRSNTITEACDMAISALHFEADCRSCMWREKYEEQTEPSDFIRQETIKELGDWLEQMIQHGVPSHSAKRKALANAIALLSMDTHEIHTETHECVKETHDSDLISREDLLKKAEKGNITKYSTNSVNIITTDVVTVENIKKAPSADTPTTEVKKPTNTPTDLISRADAVAYPLGFDHYDKENGSREFICGVESYREYIQHLPSVSADIPTIYVGIDTPYGNDKGLATVFKDTDGKLILKKVKEICLDDFADRPTEDKCDGCLYEDSDKSLFPCTYCKRNHFDKYEKDESSADRPTVVHCRECVRKKNCWMFDEHKDDNGTCVWAEPYYITESPNDVDETDDEVIEPSDIISRADAKKEVYLLGKNPSINEIWDCLDALPSADAEPKWNCTANFVAEQLDRLRNMTDEERWDFFIKFFSPSADIQTEDYSDLPDIPRAYYEKIVGNMSHEINMLKQQLEDRPMVHSERPAEWIKEIEGNGWNEWENITCSHCGAKVEKVKYLGGGKRWNYCPNCGSYMKGGAE